MPKRYLETTFNKASWFQASVFSGSPGSEHVENGLDIYFIVPFVLQGRASISTESKVNAGGNLGCLRNMKHFNMTGKSKRMVTWKRDNN